MHILTIGKKWNLKHFVYFCLIIVLNILKIVNWAKIYSQFHTRKELYRGHRSIALNSPVSLQYRENSFGHASVQHSPFLKEPTINATRFNSIEFLFHIGSFNAGIRNFNAVQLQKQIVEFLDVFFRLGNNSLSFPSKIPLISTLFNISPKSVDTPDQESLSKVLSLAEISKVIYFH
jgi:hypothetical protein